MNTKPSNRQNKGHSDKLVSTNSHKKPYKRKTKLQLVITLLGAAFQTLEYLSPNIAGWWAYRMWLATHRFPEPANEKCWLKTADVTSMAHQYGPITIYQWHQNHSNNPPRVLLVHGWNGRGLQLGAFVKPLLENGFEVISFDAPGHGRSPGKDCNLLQIADVVHSISKNIGPIDTIIGHSFGAMVMARVANDGLKMRKAVAISSPINADYLIDGFCSVLKIKDRSKDNLLNRLHKYFGKDIFARISAVNNLSQLSLAGMIVHDEDDKEIPLEHAYLLNKSWSDSEILITEKLGHLRILRNKDVVAKIVDFIVKN